MYTVQFDTLKSKAKNEIDRQLVRHHAGEGAFLAILAATAGVRPERPATVIGGWRNEAHKIVDAWDVRKALELVRLFPSIMPARFTVATTIPVPRIEYNEKAEWVLIWA